MKKIIAMIAFGVMLMSLVGCGSEPPKTDYSDMYRMGEENPTDTEGKMIFDFLSASMGLSDGNSPYHEMTVNEVDGALYVNVYSGDLNLGTTETHQAYIGTPELFNELMAATNKYSMSKWNDEAGDAEAGGLRVVKFPDSTGKIIRVSNENMPSDGNAAFGEINSILNQYFEGNPTCVLE